MNNWFYCFTQASLLASIKQLTRTFQLASLGQLYNQKPEQSTSRVSGPGSLVILGNHRALKHAFVYCKLICNTSCSSTLKTKMKPEYEWFGSLENHRALNHVFVYCKFIYNSPPSNAQNIKVMGNAFSKMVLKNDENFCVNTSQIETAVILLQEITGSNLAIVRSCNSNAMLQNLTRSWWFGSFTKSPDTKTRFVYRIFLMFMSSKSQNMKHLKQF
ncbi:hypothetical protein T01_9748 [Trichinella spiralis]|uniref:Uncharacterized protein n=1 Tax=Trichinella spiralis TaxID=6334 RepID=A0A0V1BT55_TRISP|nr:hypothetical protein T01_9748 [Trichinella spiralis]